MAPRGQAGQEAVAIAGDREPMLLHAVREAQERGLYDIPVVDVDCHINENALLPDIGRYIENPAIRRHVLASARGGGRDIFPSGLGDRTVAGRIKRYGLVSSQQGYHDPDAVVRAMRMMAIDYAVLFPTPMLTLGTHPDVEVEVGLSRAFNRYLVDRFLSRNPRLKSMLYLPLNDPEEALKVIEDFGEAPGVIGFMVTCVRNVPVHHKRCLPIYAALEERGLPIAFHSGPNWSERPFEQLNRFLSVHALTFPLYCMIHMCNIVINGLPERFPRLKWIFMEAGVTYLPFLMTRLDNEFLMRPSEAPLLQRKPSEYIREFYFSSQPLEIPERLDVLEMTFDLIRAETQLLYASDFPHWDFDLPGVITDIPFLSPMAKRNILGENALRLFNLPRPELQGPPPDLSVSRPEISVSRKEETDGTATS